MIFIIWFINVSISFSSTWNNMQRVLFISYLRIKYFVTHEPHPKSEKSHNIRLINLM